MWGGGWGRGGIDTNVGQVQSVHNMTHHLVITPSRISTNRGHLPCSITMVTGSKWAGGHVLVIIISREIKWDWNNSMKPSHYQEGKMDEKMREKIPSLILFFPRVNPTMDCLGCCWCCFFVFDCFYCPILILWDCLDLTSQLLCCSSLIINVSFHVWGHVNNIFSV